MKRIFLLLLLFCGLAGSATAQGNFLKTIKKGIESTTGLKISDEMLFVYPTIGEWRMDLESCIGDKITNTVILKIKVTKTLGNRIVNERCLISEAVITGEKTPLGLKGFSADPMYNFEIGQTVDVTFQPIYGVPESAKLLDVKFYIQIPSTERNFEVRRVPIVWLDKSQTTFATATEPGAGTLITDTITSVTTTVTPGSVEWVKVNEPGRTEIKIAGSGYDIKELRTCFFQFKNSNGELEVVDAEIFDESQFVYSLAVGLKDKRFPVEKAYANMGITEEDEVTKDYYMKHRAKCFVVAEKGKTPIAEREMITENYLYLAINKFVNDNADNGLYVSGKDGLQRIIPRTKLIKSLFGINLNTDKEILNELEDTEIYFLDYISAHPPKKSKMKFMGDNEASCYDFEYRFYDMELMLHAFLFSPITLHYEMRSWYDKDFDLTVYAYFYCVGYDDAGMKQTIGAEAYNSTKADFKKNNDLDFNLYPLQCLMTGFEKDFILLPNPPTVEEIYFPGQLSWFSKKTPPKKETTVKKTPVKTQGNPPKEPEKYTVSPNSAARIEMNVLDIAEDAKYTYLAGSANYASKLIAIEKSTGKITEVYKAGSGKENKGDVKRLMKDNDGKVLVEFSDYPVMTCHNAKLEDTKLRFFDNWEVFIYSKLKAVLPNGDVLLVRYGNENILADRNGAIKFSSKELYFGELPSKVAVSKQGVIWEPGQGGYVQVEGLGTNPQPAFTKLATGYDSQFKGSVNEIKIAPNGDVYIASGFGLHKSPDNGKTWQSVKSVYAYGSFERIALNQASEAWTATGESLVKYDNKLNMIFRTAEFDITDKDGKKIKIQTAPRILFSDSANNLWIVGGTYSAPGVIIFNPNGITGYTEIAGKKQLTIQ